jgi:hypothetical protein
VHSQRSIRRYDERYGFQVLYHRFGRGLDPGKISDGIIQQYFLCNQDITLPKMASKGKLVSHTIRKTRKPLVSEISAPKETEKSLQETPTYVIVCEPEQDPKYIVVQVHLPLLLDSQGVELDVEEKRVFLNHERYYLEVALPAPVEVEESAAQFDCSTKYLHLSLTCLQNS